MASPAPAFASYVQSFQSDALRNNTYLTSRGTNQSAGVQSVNGRVTRWTVEFVKPINGHSMVKLKDASNEPSDGCLDSNGQNSGGNPQVKACNDLDNQKWEQFSFGNYFVFKSYGAFSYHGWHVCIQAPTGLNPDHTNKVFMYTCNTDSRYQRWF
ncbi:ricin-type beta-trefoil lectin domain protein [Krasilnikovia sp. MM14-A1004]|uniref:ricin-type beta-trefoil lectin domain protein n=1 Tax=Krasilnikovia sp. MM14-A1004 TaxID=3373541 RepID=UPI00399CDCD2